MMMEVALVFDKQGKTLHWHLPPGATGGSLPDSRPLWDVLWEHRDPELGPDAQGNIGTGRLGGVAHTHPWKGKAYFSETDVTTFRACELGLGRLYMWPVVTFSEVGYYVYNVVTEGYVLAQPTILIEGIDELRHRSGYEGPRTRPSKDTGPTTLLGCVSKGLDNASSAGDDNFYTTASYNRVILHVMAELKAGGYSDD